MTLQQRSCRRPEWRSEHCISLQLLERACSQYAGVNSNAIRDGAVAEKLGLQELRDYNLLDFGEDDMLRRKEDAHKARPKFIPSGGLAGFRVASDLAKMDFTAAEESE